NLVRVLEDSSGTEAILQVDRDGATNGARWTTIAQLDGVHAGDDVKVIFDASQPAATLTVAGLVPADTMSQHRHDGGHIYGLPGRDPDLFGHQGWRSAGAHEASPHDMAHAGMSSAQFIDSHYANAFGRHSGPSGLQGWMNELAGGASQTMLSARIVES